jgi:hypothetical protein
MKRPFASKRPIGPFFSQNKFTELTGNRDKEVIGVAGTPFPNVDKEELLVIYVLEGMKIFQTNKSETAIQRKINGRNEYDGYTVDVLKSGESSKKQFKEQAVLIRVPADDIATTRTDLELFERIITREVNNTDSDEDVRVKEIIYEMKGTP